MTFISMNSKPSLRIDDGVKAAEKLKESATSIPDKQINNKLPRRCECCQEATQQKLQSGWQTLRRGSHIIRNMNGFMGAYILRSVMNESCYAKALATTLASQVANRDASFESLKSCFSLMYSRYPELVLNSMSDLYAYAKKDPACNEMVEVFLFYKGFHAIQIQRLANRYWQRQEVAEAYWLQNRASVLFGVDIHPAARLGSGLFFDHATGIVIGETVEMGNDVSLLHGVTLGGKGTEMGDRHPKIGHSVTIGANATLLGNIQIGDKALIGASTVVLKDVPANSRVVGNPARYLS